MPTSNAINKVSPRSKALLQTIALGAVFSLSAVTALAQKPEVVLSKLTWADQSDLERKVRQVDELGRRHFGVPVRGDKSDLKLLQRIANEKLIEPENTAELQALGAVMGELLAKDLGLRWVVYEDDLGRNRALCYRETTNCLFPLTMLSRRIEVGAKVDVEKIYQDAVAAIDPYLPDENGFDGKKTPPGPEWGPPTGPVKKIRML